jgi:deoxycytidine triphosphate deaminase
MKTSGERSGGMFLRRIVDLFTFGHHSHTQIMARVLSDKEIKRLIGEVIIGADPRLINPNGIELRLGKEIRFMSTNERKPIALGHFVNVHPGEAVMIDSVESLNFKKEVVRKYFPGCSLMALITPTTTMMREGMLQSATKVHAGYAGGLNWGFRNSSSKDFIMRQGEPLFNLTLFLLEGDEIPDVEYGENPNSKYQNSAGVVISQRNVPADIPKEQIVSSSFHKLDVKVQLREAGHPFNYIGSELVSLQDKFELVNSGVAALNAKMDDAKKDLLTTVDCIFQNKFLWAGSICVGVVCGLFAVRGFLQPRLTPNEIASLALGLAIAIPLFGWLVFYRKK